MSDLSEARSFVSFFLAPEIKKSHVPTLGLYLEFPTPGGKKNKFKQLPEYEEKLRVPRKLSRDQPGSGVTVQYSVAKTKPLEEIQSSLHISSHQESGG